MRHVSPTTTTNTTTWFNTIKDYVLSIFFSSPTPTPTKAPIPLQTDTFGSIVLTENYRPFFYHEPHAKHPGRFLTNRPRTFKPNPVNPRPRLNIKTSLGSTNCRPPPKTLNHNAPPFFIEYLHHDRPRHTSTYHTSLRRRTYLRSTQHQPPRSSTPYTITNKTPNHSAPVQTLTPKSTRGT